MPYGLQSAIYDTARYDQSYYNRGYTDKLLNAKIAISAPTSRLSNNVLNATIVTSTFERILDERGFPEGDVRIDNERGFLEGDVRNDGERGFLEGDVRNEDERF